MSYYIIHYLTPVGQCLNNTTKLQDYFLFVVAFIDKRLYLLSRGSIMKKIVMFLVLMTIGSVIYAEDNGFRFYSFGEFAYYPALETKGYSQPDGVYFGTEIGIGFEYNFINFGLFVETTQKTYMTKGTTYMFRPFKAEFYISAGISFWAITLEYQHLCVHNIEWSGTGGGHDKISIAFDSRRLSK